MLGFAWSVHANQAVILSILCGGIVGFGRYVIRPMFRFAQRVEKSLGYVEGQMRTNGGTTLRDKVDVLVHRVDQLETLPQAKARTANLESHLVNNAAEVAAALKETP